MAVNETNFTIRLDTCGVFEVYTSKDKWMADSYSYVKATIDVSDMTLSHKIIDKLVALQFAMYSPVKVTTHFNVRLSPMSIRSTNRKVMVHSVTMRAKAQAVVAWLNANMGDMPLTVAKPVEIKTDKLSVGPCAYRANGHTYVKVRFDGISVVYFFDKQTGFLKDLTAKHLTNLGPTLADDVLNILVAYSPIILERANERLLNLSGISEYGEHQLHYFEKIPFCSGYRFVKPTQSQFADPNFKPILVVHYGRSNDGLQYRDQTFFTIMDDTIYAITKFTIQEKDGATIRTIEAGQAYLFDGFYFTQNDCQLVPANDEYVRERIVRALKAKL